MCPFRVMAGDLLDRPMVVIPVLVPVDIRFEAMQSPLKVPGQESSVVDRIIELQWLKKKDYNAAIISSTFTSGSSGHLSKYAPKVAVVMNFMRSV